MYQSVRRQCTKKYCDNWRSGAWWIPYKIVWKKSKAQKSPQVTRYYFDLFSRFWNIFHFWIIFEFFNSLGFLNYYWVFNLFSSLLNISEIFNFFQIFLTFFWWYLIDFREFEWISSIWMNFVYLNEFRVFVWFSRIWVIFEVLNEFPIFNDFHVF